MSIINTTKFTNFSILSAVIKAIINMVLLLPLTIFG